MITLKRTAGGYVTKCGTFAVKDMNPAYRSIHPGGRVMGLRWRLEVPGLAAPVMCSTLEDVRFEIARIISRARN